MVEKVEVEVERAVGDTIAVEVVNVLVAVLVVRKVEVGPLKKLACVSSSWRNYFPTRSAAWWL